jgi:hypothetical protein
MISRDRSRLTANSLQRLPQLNADNSVLLQVLSMGNLGQSDFCNSLTASNDALIVAELKPPSSPTLTMRLKLCEQSIRTLIATIGRSAETVD